MVSILDALAAAQHAAGLALLGDPEFGACNVNGTPGGSMAPGTNVSILDALAIARYAAALGGPLPCAP